MWLAYARTAADARDLSERLLALHEGEIVWCAWPCEATWMEVRKD